VQPDGAVVGTGIADDENEAATTSQPGENTAEPSYSLIYTDNACDMDGGDRADAVVATDWKFCQQLQHKWMG